MKQNKFRFIASLLSMALIYSCGASEKNEIQKLLLKRESAIETKNTELYLDCISDKYRGQKDGKTIGFDDIRKSFESNSKIFDSIELTSSDINIYMKNNNTSADVYQKTQFRLSIGDNKSKHSLVEEITLQKFNGKWKITKESDADLFKIFAFGSPN